MRAVNLLPRDETRARLEARRVPLLVAGAGIALVTVGGLLLGHSATSSTQARRAELASVQALIARLPRAEVAAIPSGAIAQARNDRIAALLAAVSNRLAFDRLLHQIALVLPENAWLTGLKAAVPTALGPTIGVSGSSSPSSAQAPAASEDVTIEGATYSQDSVARVLARLALVPALDNVRLTASALVDPAASGGSQPQGASKPKVGKKVVTFTVTASLRAKASS